MTTPINPPLGPEHRAKVRELLLRRLIDPADVDAALAWCDEWVASRPYAIGTDDHTPWTVVGAYHTAMVQRERRGGRRVIADLLTGR